MPDRLGKGSTASYVRSERVVQVPAVFTYRFNA